ncbi:MAG TPA: LysR substrate-binding domain-containing protein [Solirubrobacteraceae bacterium]|jgi:DNA-binding transcriptional LysR family regulator|nr:LysR substrate-binding domain-containing protein [Solirubrobacteraceae bacterium]
MVELRHLRYFIAVAEELNFSRAAQRMHMAQPPLSAAIRQLERDLGVDLFVRTTREVRLTDAGHAFLAGARRTLADAERAAEDAKRAAAGELGHLRIAYSWSTRFETLPALGRAFRASHPDVELLAQELWNARMPPAFAGGSIDIAVSLCPEIAAELELAPIRKEHLVALLPETHSLAHQDAIPLSALAAADFILFPREIAPRLHDAFMSIYRRAGFEPRVRTESFHTGWDLGVLAEIPAVAMAPQTVAGGLPDGIVAVAISEPTDALETCLVWRADDPSHALAAFVEVARSAFDPGVGRTLTWPR